MPANYHSRCVLIAKAVLCLLVGSALAKAAEPWPQWRGPARDGHATGDQWPGKLGEDSLAQLWRVPLAPSYSGPVVSDTLVFSTETRDKKEEAVYAFDRQTGEERWRVAWPGAMEVPAFAASNGSWVRSTPALDGNRLYVAGMLDVLVCLNAGTGDELWRVDFVKEFESAAPTFGFVCSPLVDSDAVYVQAGGAVVKLDKLTGKVVWKCLDDGGGMIGSAFSSPVIATLAGQRQLIVQTRDLLAGVDLETGDVLWEQLVPAFQGMNILTPVVFGDAVFTSTYQNGSWLYAVSRDQDRFHVETAWENKAQGYMSTPVVIDGHAYLQLQNERFTCIDLKTGDRTWTSRPYAKYASLVAHRGKILALLSDGRLLLIEANAEEFALLGEVRLTDQETWAQLAVSGDELYVRELEALTAYRWE